MDSFPALLSPVCSSSDPLFSETAREEQQALSDRDSPTSPTPLIHGQMQGHASLPRILRRMGMPCTPSMTSQSPDGHSRLSPNPLSESSSFTGPPGDQGIGSPGMGEKRGSADGAKLAVPRLSAKDRRTSASDLFNGPWDPSDRSDSDRRRSQ